MTLLPTRRTKDMFREFEKVLDGFTRDMQNDFASSVFPGFLTTSKNSYPKVDVYTDSEFLNIHATVPGLKKEDVNVEYCDGCLTISANKQTQEEVKRENTILKEIHKSSFVRSFKIPEDEYSISEIDGNCEDGILKLKIPIIKREKNKEVRKIELK